MPEHQRGGIKNRVANCCLKRGLVVRLKSRVLSVHNVVSHSAVVAPGDDFFEIVGPVSEYFKQVLMQNGHFTSGPMMFSWMPGSDRFTLMTSLGNRINIVEDSAESFSFSDQVEVESDFFYRHTDIEEEIPYEEILDAVAAAGRVAVTIYHVVLKVYGDVMLDLYLETEPAS